MIRLETAESAIRLAEEFDARRLLINAQPGTPLALLNETFTLSQRDLAKTEGEDYKPDAQFINGISTNWGGQLRGEEILHTNTVDELVQKIVPFVQSHLKFAKTVVKPLVVELAENFSKAVASIEIDPYQGTEVVVYDLPEPLRDPSLVEDIYKFKNSVNLPELKYLPFQEKAVSEIMEMLLTGQSSLDETIKHWAAGKGEAFFDLVWRSVFTPLASEQNFATLRNGPEGIDVCLAVYLLCNKLFDTPPEAIRMTMGSYNTMVKEFKENAALKLGYAAQTYQAMVKTGSLIFNIAPKKIEVVGETYRKWIEDPINNNGIILAATLMDRPVRYVTQIDEQRVELQKRWERHVAMVNTTETNKRFVKYKNILQALATSIVDNNFKTCYGNLREDVQYDTTLPEYQQFKDRLENLIPTLLEKDFKDVWELSLRVIADCVFFYTDAGKILRSINEACRQNPKLDVNEAAYLALISYVTDYVCDQIEVKSI